MKLRNYVLVTIVIFTLILAGCSSGNDDDTTQTTTTENQTEANEDTATQENSNAYTADTTEDENSTDPVEEEEALEEETVEEEEEEEDGDIDVSLLDRALLESVDFNMPDSFMTVAEGLSSDIPETIVTYQKGYNNRTETTSEGVTSISIYNHDLATTYDYTLGEPTGWTYVSDAEDIADIESEMDSKGMSLMAWVEEEMDFDEDTLIKASQEKINGRKTIYLSIAGAETDEEGFNPVFQIWFDKKYTVPMKYIINFGEEWTFSMEVIEYDFSPKLDDDLFLPPDDVTFE